jgi:hypothetical protein
MADRGANRDGAYGDEIPPGLLRPRNGAGRAAGIFGVVALLCAIGFFLVLTVPIAVVLGLLAIVLGIIGRGRVRRGIATNPGAATLGIVTGLLSLLLLGGLVVAGVTVWNHNKDNPTFKNFQQCAQSAGTDSQKLQQCSQQFKNDVSR